MPAARSVDAGRRRLLVGREQADARRRRQFGNGRRDRRRPPGRCRPTTPRPGWAAVGSPDADGREGGSPDAAAGTGGGGSPDGGPDMPVEPGLDHPGGPAGIRGRGRQGLPAPGQHLGHRLHRHGVRRRRSGRGQDDRLEREGRDGRHVSGWSGATRSAALATNTRDAKLVINGVTAADTVTFAYTTDWNMWQETPALEVQLAAGSNFIQLAGAGRERPRQHRLPRDPRRRDHARQPELLAHRRQQRSGGRQRELHAGAELLSGRRVGDADGDARTPATSSRAGPAIRPARPRPRPSR